MKPLLRILLSIVIVVGVVWVPLWVDDTAGNIFGNSHIDDGVIDHWFWGLLVTVFCCCVILFVIWFFIYPFHKWINWIKGK